MAIFVRRDSAVKLVDGIRTLDTGFSPYNGLAKKPLSSGLLVFIRLRSDRPVGTGIFGHVRVRIVQQIMQRLAGIIGH